MCVYVIQHHPMKGWIFITKYTYCIYSSKYLKTLQEFILRWSCICYNSHVCHSCKSVFTLSLSKKYWSTVVMLKVDAIKCSHGSKLHTKINISKSPIHNISNEQHQTSLIKHNQCSEHTDVQITTMLTFPYTIIHIFTIKNHKTYNKTHGLVKNRTTDLSFTKMCVNHICT